MTSIPDDVRIDFYLTSSWIKFLSRENYQKNVLSGSTVCDIGFEFDVALELKICKSEFPDRENRGYNDYDSLASSKPSNFIENTGMKDRPLNPDQP